MVEDRRLEALVELEPLPRFTMSRIDVARLKGSPAVSLDSCNRRVVGSQNALARRSSPGRV